jgi:hypothetical protein
MTKRILAILLAALMLGTAVACTGSDGPADTDESADAGTTRTATDGTTAEPETEPETEPLPEDFMVTEEGGTATVLTPAGLAYPEQDYWRGRIWAPTNFLAYSAMKYAGLKKECGDLARKPEELLLKEWRLHGHIHENYSGDTGMGCDKDNSDPLYHWGGLLAYIAMDHEGQS